MNGFFTKLYSRSRGYLSKFIFKLFDRRLQHLAPGIYQAKHSFFSIKEESFENEDLVKLSRGINCLKIAVDACYESVGWQSDSPLIEWLKNANAENGHIREVGWIHSELVALVKKHGIASARQECLSIGQLCSKILDNQLILASVTLGFKEKWKNRSSVGGHFVIVYGFEWQDSTCTGFYVLDPDEPTQFEKFIFSDLFIDAFSERAIFVSTDGLRKNYGLQKKIAWVEVKLNAIEHNIKEIRRLVGNHISIIAVVKSDAYGHGIVEVSKTLLKNGATILAVASMDEALKLRNHGISAPILLLYGVPIWEVEQAVALDLTVAVFDLALAKSLSATAREQGKIVKVHVKVDTGMGWFGLSQDDLLKFVLTLRRFPNITIEGIFSHFSNADAIDQKYTLKQLNCFKEGIEKFQQNGIKILYYHIANSAATLERSDAYFNAVRPGLIIYGLYPSEMNKAKVDLQPVLTFKTRILQLRYFSPGQPIGYGSTYVPIHHIRIGVLPIGYFDGIPRHLSNREGEVLINGHRARIVGNICMNMCMLDVTHIPNVQVGDEVVIIGQQGKECISASDIASKIDTISYDILVNIGNHIPRIYL